MSASPKKINTALVSCLKDHPEGRATSKIIISALELLGRTRVTSRFVADATFQLEELVVDGHLCWRPGEGNDAVYVLRDTFFSDTRFLVHFTEHERKQGYLVPGHRFVPFVSPEIPPPELHLNYRGTELGRRTVQLSLEDMAVFVSLLRRSRMIDYLLFDNSPTVLDAAGLGQGLIETTVFDMEPVLADTPTAASLVVRTVSHDRGELVIEEVRERTKILDFARSQEMVIALDSAFDPVFTQWEPDVLAVEGQMACAYAAMRSDFFTDPPFHFGAYLDLSRNVQLAAGVIDTVLWYRGQDPRDVAHPALQEMAEQLDPFYDGESSPDTDDEEQQLAALLEPDIPASEQLQFHFVDPPTPSAEKRTPSDPTAQESRQAGAAKLYTFKVALDGNRRIQRLIEVHAENTWEDLHEAIFAAFDRFDPHLYAFFLTGKRTQSRRKRCEAPRIECLMLSEGGGTGQFAEETTVGEMRLKTGTVGYYLFDFGDDWWHEFTVTDVRDAETASPKDYPHLVKKTGESPPQYQ